MRPTRRGLRGRRVADPLRRARTRRTTARQATTKAHHRPAGSSPGRHVHDTAVGFSILDALPQAASHGDIDRLIFQARPPELATNKPQHSVELLAQHAMQHLTELPTALNPVLPAPEQSQLPREPN